MSTPKSLRERKGKRRRERGKDKKKRMKESEGVSLWHCLPPNVVFFILLISGYLALVWVQFPKEFQAKNTLKKSQLLNEFLNLKKKTKK